MRIERCLARLVRTVKSLQAHRSTTSARGRAVTDLRTIMDWICSQERGPMLVRRRPNLLEKNLSELATRIFRKRKTGSCQNIIVRLWPMSRTWGQAIAPNQILLDPSLCGKSRVLADVLCHELAHHTRGIEEAHDEVFKLEMAAIRIAFRRSIERRITRTLSRSV